MSNGQCIERKEGRNTECGSEGEAGMRGKGQNPTVCVIVLQLPPLPLEELNNLSSISVIYDLSN